MLCSVSETIYIVSRNPFVCVYSFILLAKIALSVSIFVASQFAMLYLQNHSFMLKIICAIRKIICGIGRITFGHLVSITIHKKGYCILNNKHLPLHSDLLRSNSLIVDTYSVILWNLQTISYRWPSLTIEDDSLSNKPLSTKHHNTTNLLISNFPCSMTLHG